MKQSISEIADRYTILFLKRKHGIPVDENLTEYETVLQNVDYHNLYAINQIIWTIEEMITIETDLCKIGVFYLALRWANSRRVEAKNEIAKKHGGFVERKKY